MATSKSAPAASSATAAYAATDASRATAAAPDASARPAGGTASGLSPNRPGFRPASAVPVGGILPLDRPIEYNLGRKTAKLTVRNTGDRPIQVGSHFHFFEVNRYLEFDRDASFGCHLNIPATTAIRFEPGDEKEVEVVAFGGKRRVIGFNDLVSGYTGDEDVPSYFPARMKAFRRVRKAGFKIAEASAEASSETSSETSAASSAKTAASASSASSASSAAAPHSASPAHAERTASAQRPRTASDKQSRTKK